MARIVTHTAHSPTEVKTAEKSVWICRCGLTVNENGTCSGMHKKTQDEKEDTLYCYNQDGSREIVSEDNESDCCGGGCCK